MNEIVKSDESVYGSGTRKAAILKSFGANDPRVVGVFDGGRVISLPAQLLSDYASLDEKTMKFVNKFYLAEHRLATGYDRTSPHFRYDQDGVLILNRDLINDVSIASRDKLAWVLGLNKHYDGTTEFPGLKQRANVTNLLALARREYSLLQVSLEDVVPYVERFLNLRPAVQEVRTMVYDKVMGQVVQILEVERFQHRR